MGGRSSRIRIGLSIRFSRWQPQPRLVEILERPAGQQFAPSQGPLESAIAVGYVFQFSGRSRDGLQDYADLHLRIRMNILTSRPPSTPRQLLACNVASGSSFGTGRHPLKSWSLRKTRGGSIGHIILRGKCARARSAGKPHAACDVAGAGNGLTVRLVRHSHRKRGETDRPRLRSTAPALDPTALRLFGALNYSQNSARDLRCAPNKA